MKVCFDVNVVVNLFARTAECADAVFSYDVANAREFDVYVPASALADIAYVLHRRGLTVAQVDQSLEALFQMFDVVDVNGSDGLRAHRNPMRDFEDALIAESCFRSGIDVIVTHNVKDFKESPVAAIAPSDFVRIYKPANYDYAEIKAPKKNALDALTGVARGSLSDLTDTELGAVEMERYE